MELSETAQQVLGLLQARRRRVEITAALSITPGVYHHHLATLTRAGLLREDGELPIGARAMTSPAGEVTAAQVQMFQAIGWNREIIRRVWRQHGLFGMFPPESPDRTPREQWTGQSFRRVEWPHGQSRWVVQGILLPRPDGQPVDRFAPAERAVVVSDVEAQQEVRWWDWRGLVVTTELVREWFDLNSRPLSVDHVVGLTVAVAWVMEARALIDKESLAVTAVLGGDR